MSGKIVNLTITSDSRQYPYEKRYPASMTLSELKEKLQLVVGSSSECMQIELRDKSEKFVSSLTDENATLEKLGVEDVHVSHIAVDNAVSYENVSIVEKYTIPEEKYGEREDSVRAWRRREGLKVKCDALAAMEDEAKQFKVGDRCVVQLPNQQEKRGFVSYVGLTKFKAGYWIGLTYDAPVGKHDGSVDGERYFTCENNHGAFVRPREVRKLEQNEEMEEI